MHHIVRIKRNKKVDKNCWYDSLLGKKFRTVRTYFGFEVVKGPYTGYFIDDCDVDLVKTVGSDEVFWRFNERDLWDIFNAILVCLMLMLLAVGGI